MTDWKYQQKDVATGVTDGPKPVQITYADRNSILEEVALEFDKMKVFGDTAASFASFVRRMKT